MPPRKKAAATSAANGSTDVATPAAPKATRSSARQKAAADAVAVAASQSQDATADAVDKVDDSDDKKDDSATKTNGKGKKAAATKTKKAPASKAATKAKGKGKRTRDEVSEDEAEADEPDSKKAKKDDKPAKEEKKKMVTVIKRGAAPVDPCFSGVSTHQVYADSAGVWDAMLNQTDVGKNANKFYVIQVLHPIGSPSLCTLFTRWGRVGENGQQQQRGPYPPALAVSEFKKQFKNKAATDWDKRHNMVAKKGKYTWIERSFEDEEEEDSKGESSKGKEKEEKEEPIPPSKLGAELQELCRIIFSTKLIEAHLSSMNYDAHKLPLGKLAKSTILNGFAALKTLSEVLQDHNSAAAKDLGGFRSAVETLTGRYYSIIPHVFGRCRPTIIDDVAILKKELELVDALGDMEVASKLISATVGKDEHGNPLNPIDSHFRSLHLSTMDPVSKTSKEWDSLKLYVKNTHGQTHNMTVEVQQAFRVERQDETDAWIKAGNDNLSDGERLLLWHGSRTTNFAGILKQGLRIAPPEAPVTGYMFGKGVYFADMMSKSAGYCHSYLSNGIGLMLLCEVAAKPCHELIHSDYNADSGCKNAGKRVTKGVGRVQPSGWQDAGEALENDALKGVHMPKGLPSDMAQGNYSLYYNEYIAYDISQIRLRYLLMVKM
ncbi:poly polymerase catalytic domain-containing protein [Irpex rosettiformis]|uniref:Poly polymerase catalytic domain-containing protein n=1 Tax=Irpex rosettiformis TaxID=378272 RepID=A0ACB8U6B6_9APHY|nr:poly polymerase catalytic domain-containing protein [Irpex rosettiformis]